MGENKRGREGKMKGRKNGERRGKAGEKWWIRGGMRENEEEE